MEILSQVDFGSGLKFVDNISFTVIFLYVSAPLAMLKLLKFQCMSM